MIKFVWRVGLAVICASTAVCCAYAGRSTEGGAPVVFPLDQGRAFWEQKKYDQALEEFSQAIENDSNNADAYNFRGLVYAVQGQYNQAVADFSRVIELRPQDIYAFYNRGKAYARNQRTYQAARADLNHAIEIDRTFADAYVARGNLETSEHNIASAISDYSRAISLEKNQDAEVYYWRALNYYESGQYDHAWEDLKEAGRRGYDVDPVFIVLIRDKRNAKK